MVWKDLIVMNNEEMLKVILYQTLSNRFYITSIFKYLLGEDAEKLSIMINESVDNLLDAVMAKDINDFEKIEKKYVKQVKKQYFYTFLITSFI